MGLVTLVFVTQAWFAIETYQGKEPKELLQDPVTEYNFNE